MPGAGIYAANAAGTIAEGVQRAAEAVDSGRAMHCLERLVTLTQSLAGAAAAAQEQATPA